MIFNLAHPHIDRIFERDGPIRVSAGYPETISILHEGTVQRTRRRRAGLARRTEITLGDAVHGAKRLSGTSNRVYEGPVRSRQIATDIIRHGLGLTPGPLTHIPEDATFTNFYWAGSPAVGALHALLRPLGLTWTEKDGLIRINRKDIRSPTRPPSRNPAGQNWSARSRRPTKARSAPCSWTAVSRLGRR